MARTDGEQNMSGIGWRDRRAAVWGIAGVFAIAVQARVDAADFRVGASGEYTTVAIALSDALIAGPGPHRVLIESGEHVDSLNFNVTGTRDITISGGWGSGFVTQAPLPSASVLRAGLAAPVLRATVSDQAILTVENLTVTGTQGNLGGGMRVDVQGSGQLRLRDVVISDNTTTSLFGAGLHARLVGNAVLDVERVDVHHNRSLGAGAKSGAGIKLSMVDASVAWLRQLDLHDNRDSVDATASFGIGMDVSASQSAFFILEDARIHDQVTDAPSASGVGMAVGLSGAASAVLDRIDLRRNNAAAATSGNREQLGVTLSDQGTLRLENSLVAEGAGNGMIVNANTTGSTRLTNLTIADQTGYGIRFFGSGGLRRFANSVVHNAGLTVTNDFSPGTERHHNLGNVLNGVDPQFVASGDHHVSPSSPAVDAGDDGIVSVAPGLDLDSQARFQGAHVDIGAYERVAERVFGDSFEGDAP